MTRLRLWLHDRRLGLIAKYQNWVLFHADLRREQQPAKRSTPP